MDLGALVRRLVAGPTGAGGAAPSGDSGGAPSSDASPGSALARPAWRDMPPLQRVVGAAPLVAPNAAFEARLASSQPPPLALAPLGHDRGLEAPAGLVAGIAAPVQRTPSSPMPASVRPTRGERGRDVVQRSAAGPAWPDASSDFSAETVPPAAAAVAEPELVTPTPPSPALTTAVGPASELVGFVGHAAVASAGRGASLPVTAAAIPATPPGAAASPVIARAAAPGAGAAAAAPAAALSPRATAPSDERPVRRIRVGAPLTPTVSRMAVPGAPPPASGIGVPIPTPGMTSEIPAVAVAGPTQGPSAPELAAPEPAGIASSSGAPLPAAMSVVPLQRSHDAAPGRRPLVGGLRPMLASGNPLVSVSRSAAPEAEIDVAAGSPGPSAAMAALARVDPGAADWAPTAMAGVAATQGAGMPGFAIEPSSPGGITPARLTWSNPMADLSTPSARSAAMPPAGDAAAAAPAAAGPSVSRAAASGPAVSRLAARTGGLRVGQALDGAAVRPSAATVSRSFAPSASPAASPAAASWSSPSRPASPSAGSSSATSPSVSRAVVIDEIESTVEPSAAESGAGEAGAASSGASASEQGASAAGGGSVVPSAGASEAARDQETQAWADRLYDRIALRLRRDLLVERERAGALVDRGF